MHSMTLIIRAFAVALFTLPVSVYASSWSCSHGNDVREIHVERPDNASVPCSVVYRKLTEGVEDQILWNAENDADYCDQKAKEFVAKQESWGWVCAETIRDDADTTETMTDEAGSEDSGSDTGSEENGSDADSEEGIDATAGPES